MKSDKKNDHYKKTEKPGFSYPCFSSNAQSIAKECLNAEIFSRLNNLKTQSGFTLYDALKSGIINPDSYVGIYAGDAESYKTFESIFNPVIESYHSINIRELEKHVESATQHHNNKDHVKFFPKHKLELPDPDPEKKYIISTRIRLARNLDGFPFTTSINLKDRLEIEKIVVTALKKMPFQFQGRYKSFYNESIPTGFTKGDRFQEAAGINRDWPVARGVFESDNGKFAIWINEEDHLRIISMAKNTNLSRVFTHLQTALESLEKNLVFAWDPLLGYLTSCPSNLGTGMRVGVHIKLPKLYKKKDCLNDAAKKFNLQIRGTHGEKTEVESAIFDISNSQRLGISEHECCHTLHKGICSIIEMEENINI
ncbi:Arginine kinase [Desulfamplus magnetovallimortis]|uniref:Arginine kinase n=1 Tax=Desulfamplus magnetovallimortis TaxID=1246637 RepID=A0A1W1HDH5_9BACT|nr:phosphagen kinase [Desulfamplus magnetovallimortis]SLM30529.1 Arginine kinase [Desulfamplus magnetovallimortis]